MSKTSYKKDTNIFAKVEPANKMLYIYSGRIRVTDIEGSVQTKFLERGTVLGETKPYYARGYLSLGDLYADAGQKEKAIENLKQAEAMYQEMGMDFWLAQTRKLLEMARI